MRKSLGLKIGLWVVVVAVAATIAMAVAEKLTAKEPMEGMVEAREYEVTSRYGGRIVEIRVEEGDYVRVGDTLAVIDSPGRKTKKKQNKETYMMLQQIKASFDKAEKEYFQAKRLYEEGIINETERDEAFADYKAMEAQVKVAEEMDNMAHETTQISRAEGEVSGIFHDIGDNVDRGETIMTISEINHLWGEFDLTEKNARKIQRQDTLKVEVPAFGKEIDMAVYSVKDNKIRVRAVEPLDGLRPGMHLFIK